MNTAELIGPPLNWAVAKCEGLKVVKRAEDYAQDFWISRGGDYVRFDFYQPSSIWAQGGPIIERERIETGYIINGGLSAWRARPFNGSIVAYGPTPLIAAMRCYVASKLGDEVKIPKELVG